MSHIGYILIVDDDAATRAVVDEVLKDEGYLVQSVPDSTSAWATLADRAPNLILCDLRLPSISGLAFAREMRQAGFDIPFVIMTADINAVRSADLGDVAGYILKPFDLEDLLICVNAQIRLE